MIVLKKIITGGPRSQLEFIVLSKSRFIRQNWNVYLERGCTNKCRKKGRFTYELGLLSLESVWTKMAKDAYILSAHYARRYMSNRMIHVQQSFPEIAQSLNKFWLVESWFLYTGSSSSRYIAQRNYFWPIRIQDTGCLIASDWSKIVPLCDVSAAAGPCIQKPTFNQSELV